MPKCISYPIVTAIALYGMLQTAHAEPMSVAEIRERVEENYTSALALYREFLALPNDAMYPEDILKLVQWMEPEFAARGFRTRKNRDRRQPAAPSPKGG